VKPTIHKNLAGSKEIEHAPNSYYVDAMSFQFSVRIARVNHTSKRFLGEFLIDVQIILVHNMMTRVNQVELGK